LLVRSPVPDGPWDQGDASTRAVRREFVAALQYATNLRKTEHTLRHQGPPRLASRDLGVRSKEGILLSQRLLDAVRAMNIEHGGESLRITVSIGMCQARGGEGPEAWLERTDRALYDARKRAATASRIRTAGMKMTLLKQVQHDSLALR